MNDSIGEITSKIQAFVAEREWEVYHDAKEMSVALMAEAGELLQHFVWQQGGQVAERVEQDKAAIASEVADIGILLFELADRLGLKLGDVMMDKLEANGVRYPVEKARGNNKKYNRL